MLWIRLSPEALLNKNKLAHFFSVNFTFFSSFLDYLPDISIMFCKQENITITSSISSINVGCIRVLCERKLNWSLRVPYFQFLRTSVHNKTTSLLIQVGCFCFPRKSSTSVANNCFKIERKRLLLWEWTCFRHEKSSFLVLNKYRSLF